MNRAQKRCFIASACVHGSLVLVLVVGSAFTHPTVSLPVIEMVNLSSLKATDQLAFGGGTPAAGGPMQRTVTTPPAATPPPQPTVTAPPLQPTPAPQPAAREVPPEPPKIVHSPEAIPMPPLKKDTKKSTTKKSVEPEKKKSAKETTEDEPPKRNLFAKPTTRKADEVKAAQAAAERQHALQRARESQQQAVKDATGRLAKGLSSGVGIEVNSSPGGFGGGGQAFANFAQILRSVYDQAWMDPQDVSDDRASTRVRVIIGRDGRVISSSIIKSSGIRAMDRSVEDALRRVDFVHELPEGSKEQQRTFEFNFNLKAKRLAG